jgi:hypothetical protein
MGSQNSAVGGNALELNTSGGANAAFGWGALQNNTGGANNTAIGSVALLRNSDGGDNTATGWAALKNNDSGSSNTATGFQSLVFTTGSGNIGLGFDAGLNLTTGSNNIDIGNEGVAAESGIIRIGTSVAFNGYGPQTAVYIAGISGATTGLAGSAVVVDANGQLGTISSSRRYKEHIEPMANASERLLKLRPVQFRYKKPDANGEKPIQYGLIAEEVVEVLPELVVNNKDGQPETVAYHLLPAMLLNELQKEHAKNEQHTEQITAQEKVIHDQAAQIAKLEAKASEVEALKARLADLERVTTLLAKMSGGDGVSVRSVSRRVVDLSAAGVH